MQLAKLERQVRSLPEETLPKDSAWISTDRTTQSRADGTFSFTPIAAGQYVLFADSAGFERTSQLITVANQPVIDFSGYAAPDRFTRTI